MRREVANFNDRMRDLKRMNAKLQTELDNNEKVRFLRASFHFIVFGLESVAFVSRLSFISFYFVVSLP
jgi:hypothetical protein